MSCDSTESISFNDINFEYSSSYGKSLNYIDNNFNKSIILLDINNCIQSNDSINNDFECLCKKYILKYNTVMKQLLMIEKDKKMYKIIYNNIMKELLTIEKYKKIIKEYKFNNDMWVEFKNTFLR